MFCQVSSSSSGGRNSRVLWFIVILFLVIKLVILLLFVMIFVVVVLMVTMVIFWCLQSLWLCVCVCWPSVSSDDNVMFCVVHVVLDVDIVVICVCCDGVIHGEILVALSVLAGCPCVVVALVVVV